MSNINERIKSRRNDLGLTLLQIADALGVKEATAQRYESGEIKNIKHETIVKLSEILKCSPSYLMGWETEQKEKPVTKSGEQGLLNEPYVKEIIEKLNRLSPENRALAEAQLDLILTHQENSKK